MTVNELIEKLQEIQAAGGGNLEVFYIRESNIIRPGADEKFVSTVDYSCIETYNKGSHGVWLQ